MPTIIVVMAKVTETIAQRIEILDQSSIEAKWYATHYSVKAASVRLSTNWEDGGKTRWIQRPAL